MPLQVGSVVPTITSSAGRVFLAYLPEQVATDAARDEWRDAARQPANGWKALYSKCRNDVRAAGFAATEGGMIPGLSAVSAPIFDRSEEHTSELQSLMRISYAVFCLQKTIKQLPHKNT